MQHWMSDCIAHTDTQLAVQKRISNIKLETLPADLRCLLIPETSQVPCLGLMLLVTEFHPQLLQSMFLLPIKPRHRTADFTEMLCALCCCTFNESTDVIQKVLQTAKLLLLPLVPGKMTAFGFPPPNQRTDHPENLFLLNYLLSLYKSCTKKIIKSKQKTFVFCI